MPGRSSVPHNLAHETLAADPATRIVWQYVQRRASLRPGEVAMYRRFEMARDTYQGMSPLQSLNIIDWERRLLAMPGLGPVFKNYADPDFWTPMLAYAEIPRIPEADFEAGGRRYAVFGLDLRALSPIARWTRLTEKLIDIPWSLAAGADFSYPGVEGQKAPGTDQINWYVDKILHTVISDPEVHMAFLCVMNLIDPLPALFAPRIVLRVLSGSLARRGKRMSRMSNAPLSQGPAT